MTRLFRKRPKPQVRERAPQLTRWERQALRYPSPPGDLPYATYDAMQQDAMVHTSLNVKKRAVLATDWTLEPADSSERATEALRFAELNIELMQGSIETALEAAMDAFAKGWSLQEMVFEQRDGRVWLRALKPKDPQYFGLDIDAFGNIERLLLRIPGEDERTIPASRFAIYRHRAQYGRPKGCSDLDAAHRHWESKRTLMSAWRLHLERFAMPTVLGKFERGLPPDEQTAILNALKNLQDNTAIVYPDEIELDTLGGDRSGSENFEAALEMHNRELARAILGQTLTTTEGLRHASYALGRIHMQVFMLQVESLRRALADSFFTEGVLRPLTELNFGLGVTPRLLPESAGTAGILAG